MEGAQVTITGWWVQLLVIDPLFRLNAREPDPLAPWALPRRYLVIHHRPRLKDDDRVAFASSLRFW